MKKEEVENYLHQKIEKGETVSPILPEGIKNYLIDIDGTICTNTNGKYELATPYEERIKFINNLHIEGNVIKYFTARGSTTGICWRELTEKQLKDWGERS